MNVRITNTGEPHSERIEVTADGETWVDVSMFCAGATVSIEVGRPPVIDLGLAPRVIQLSIAGRLSDSTLAALGELVDAYRAKVIAAFSERA